MSAVQRALSSQKQVTAAGPRKCVCVVCMCVAAVASVNAVCDLVNGFHDVAGVVRAC